jgi:hypothetical protein
MHKLHRNLIPYTIGILIIFTGFLLLKGVSQYATRMERDTFVREQMEMILFFSPQAQFITVEMYETKDETFLHIQYHAQTNDPNVLFVLATKRSEKRVTQATQTLYPDIMAQYEYSKTQYTNQVIYTDSEISRILKKSI